MEPLPLLATDPGHLYLADRTPIDIEKLMQALNNMKEACSAEDRAGYLAWKLKLGATKAKSEMIGLEWKIAMELTGLGVESALRIAQNPEFNGITLSFEWNYHGQQPRTYHVTYICTDIQNPSTYPDGLKKLIANKAVDIYYQKAAYEVPRHYSKFLSFIAQGIRMGGYMLTSDYDWEGNKFAPEPYLSGSDYGFSIPEDTPLLQAYRNLFALYLPAFWDLPDVANKDDIQYHSRGEYWLFTDARSKSTGK